MIEVGGSKNSLAPQARKDRPQTATCYVRDRDFDYEPPDDLTQPVIDRHYGAEILGWHWCRHEIESYLLEPVLVEAATGVNRAQYIGALVAAGGRIRSYQIARWVVGEARRALPPHHELRTRPEDDHDFYLPPDLTLPASMTWARVHLAAHLGRIEGALGATVVDGALEARMALITEERFNDVPGVLVWCSGKDLLTALEPWLQEQGYANPGVFRRRMRDWVIENPELALDNLPEWRALVGLLRA